MPKPADAPTNLYEPVAHDGGALAALLAVGALLLTSKGTLAASYTR